MTTLREAAQQALEALEMESNPTAVVEVAEGRWELKSDLAITALRAALVEDSMQKFTDVNQELEAALAEPVQEPFALPCPTPKACRAHCCSGNCIPRSKA